MALRTLVGATGFRGAGWSWCRASGAQQQVAPQSIPHLQRWPACAAGRDLPTPTEEADASGPIAAHRPIAASVTMVTRPLMAREWRGRRSTRLFVWETGGSTSRLGFRSHHRRTRPTRQVPNGPRSGLLQGRFHAARPLLPNPPPRGGRGPEGRHPSDSLSPCGRGPGRGVERYQGSKWSRVTAPARP
jgi:hypothetical protein